MERDVSRHGAAVGMRRHRAFHDRLLFRPAGRSRAQLGGDARAARVPADRRLRPPLRCAVRARIARRQQLSYRQRRDHDRDGWRAASRPPLCQLGEWRDGHLDRGELGAAARLAAARAARIHRRPLRRLGRAGVEPRPEPKSIEGFFRPRAAGSSRPISAPTAASASPPSCTASPTPAFRPAPRSAWTPIPGDEPPRLVDLRTGVADFGLAGGRRALPGRNRHRAISAIRRCATSTA